MKKIIAGAAVFLSAVFAFPNFIHAQSTPDIMSSIQQLLIKIQLLEEELAQWNHFRAPVVVPKSMPTMTPPVVSMPSTPAQKPSSSPSPSPSPSAQPLTVSVQSPAIGSAAVTSPVHFVATAASSHPVTHMSIYDSGTLIYSQNVSKIDTALAMTAGTHDYVNVQAWDSTGAVTVVKIRFAVNASAPTPTPAPIPTPAPAPARATTFDAYPSTANILNNLENAAWAYCDCGGTGASPVAKNLTQSGSTAAFSITGSGAGVSGFLWYTHTSAPAANWIMDYDVAIDNPSAAAALEFDGNQTASANVPGNFVFGTECNYGYNPGRKTVWRFWTMANGVETWGTTAFPCPMTAANHEYHVQAHFTVISANAYAVARLRVTDLTTGTIVEDDNNLGTFSSVGANTGHGNSIDVQLDAPNGNSFTATYKNLTIVRW